MKRLVLIGGGDNGGNLSVALESQVANLFANDREHLQSLTSRTEEKT